MITDSDDFVTELVIGDNTAVTEGSVIGDTSSSEKVISDQSPLERVSMVSGLSISDDTGVTEN